MSNQIFQKFKLDFGTAFPTFMSYLSNTDKLSLSATCNMFRKLIFRPNIWPSLIITQHLLNKLSQSSQYLSWLSSYMDVIQPQEIMIRLVVQQKEELQQLQQLVMKLIEYQRPFVKGLTLDTTSYLLHGQLCRFFKNISRLSLRSNFVSDHLVKEMFQKCSNINELEIIADALDFTGQSIEKYIKQPFTKLVLKPYQLHYQSILQLLLNTQLNQIVEFQIDVEQCGETLLLKIITELKCVKRLRLFHMQMFYDPYLIASKMSTQMSELTLTKCYNLQMQPIIQKISSKELQQLDLTEAIMITDSQIEYLADKASNLRHINLSWCNQITNKSISKLMDSCKNIEKLIVNGIKNLSDQAFTQYFELKQSFCEKYYDEIRYNFKAQFRKIKQSQAEDFCNQYCQKLQVNRFFAQPLNERKTLRRLKHLQCNSCNNINDIILKIIGSFNGKCAVINYYGEDLRLLNTNLFFQDDFY